MNSELCECGHAQKWHRLIDGYRPSNRLGECRVQDCDCSRYRPSVSAPQIAEEGNTFFNSDELLQARDWLRERGIFSNTDAKGAAVDTLLAQYGHSLATRNDELLAALKELEAEVGAANKGARINARVNQIQAKQITELRAALRERELDLSLARQHLNYLWKETRTCPCGARAESLDTHPHTPGCPTEDATIWHGQLELAEMGMDDYDAALVSADAVIEK